MQTQKRYWLRGMLIVCGLVFLTILFLLPFGSPTSPSGYGFDYALYPVFFSAILLDLPFSLILDIEPSDSIIGLSGSAVIVYPIIGALLGWLYGKIKGRKLVDAGSNQKVL